MSAHYINKTLKFILFYSFSVILSAVCLHEYAYYWNCAVWKSGYPVHQVNRTVSSVSCINNNSK